MATLAALRENFTGRAAAAALSGALALAAAPAALAQDTRTAAASQRTCTDSTGYTWSSCELYELDQADRAATDYAMNTNGVGILIHVGKDIPNRHFATADDFGRAVVGAFQSQYGVEAQYFLRQNDAKATGITYHIGHLIHGAHNGTELKNVKQALAAMPEVVEQLKMVKSLTFVPGRNPQPAG